MAFREANFLEARVVVGGLKVRVLGRGCLFTRNTYWRNLMRLLTLLWPYPSAMVAMPTCAVVIDPDAEAFGFLLFPVLRALGADRGVIAGVIVLEMDAVRGE